MSILLLEGIMILTGLESISLEVERTGNKKLQVNTSMLNKITIEFLNEIVDGGVVSGDSEDVPTPEDEVEIELEVEIDPISVMEEKIDNLEKELQYSAAEIVNVRNRAIRDRNDSIKYGCSGLATRLIPIIDNLSRAINTSSNEKAASESLIEGIKLTLEGMINSLRLEGVMKIEIEKGQFDPSCMESIASIPCPEGKNPGDIIEVIEEGYKLHGRVLRPTKVIVSEG